VRKSRVDSLARIWGDRDRDVLIRGWTGYVEASARRYDQCYPGADWQGVFTLALYRAAYTFDPSRRVAFQRWLWQCIKGDIAGPKRKVQRRLKHGFIVIGGVDFATLGESSPGRAELAEEADEERAKRSAISQALSMLAPDDRKLIERRLAGDTYELLGDAFHVHKETARKRLKQAIRRIERLVKIG